MLNFSLEVRILILIILLHVFTVSYKWVFTDSIWDHIQNIIALKLYW